MGRRFCGKELQKAQRTIHWLPARCSGSQNLELTRHFALSASLGSLAGLIWASLRDSAWPSAKEMLPRPPGHFPPLLRRVSMPSYSLDLLMTGSMHALSHHRLPLAVKGAGSLFGLGCLSPNTRQSVGRTMPVR